MGIGLNWVDQFLKRHANHIQTYQAHPLKALHGKAVNEYTYQNYFDILKHVFYTGDDGELLLPENIYGSDETGFRTGEGSLNQKVVGPTGKWIQHQQKTGNQENSNKYLVKWKQWNPANAL